LFLVLIVQVFTAATGAVSASRTYQELDGNLRQLDATIRKAQRLPRSLAGFALTAAGVR